MVKNSKNNRLDGVTGNTGALPVIHDVDTKKTEIKVPASTLPPPEPVKPTGGFAKASPVFKPVDPQVKASKADEAKAIEENVVAKTEDETDQNTKST